MSAPDLTASDFDWTLRYLHLLQRTIVFILFSIDLHQRNIYESASCNRIFISVEKLSSFWVFVWKTILNSICNLQLTIKVLCFAEKRSLNDSENRSLSSVQADAFSLNSKTMNRFNHSSAFTSLSSHLLQFFNKNQVLEAMINDILTQKLLSSYKRL